MLLVLMVAFMGQKIHIFYEDDARYAAFSGDLLPDNGADSHVVAHCDVDNYLFYYCLLDAPMMHQFYVQMLAVVLPQPVCCKQAVAHPTRSLRAPPIG